MEKSGRQGCKRSHTAWYGEDLQRSRAFFLGQDRGHEEIGASLEHQGLVGQLIGAPAIGREVLAQQVVDLADGR